MGHRVTKYASQLKDFSDLSAATAEAKHLPDVIIEKDYFVVRVLRTRVLGQATKMQGD